MSGGAFRLVTVQCSVHSLATEFSCSYDGFTLIRTQVIIFLLDLGITKCFMKFFFNFERVLLATRGYSRTLKPPNSPPLIGMDGIADIRRRERGTFCHGAHSVSRSFSITIQYILLAL